MTQDQAALGVVVLATILGAMLFWWLGSRSARARLRRRNAQLDAMLLNFTSGQQVNSDFRHELMRSQLLAVEAADATGTPMSFSARFPANMAPQGKMPAPSDDGRIHFGPCIFCFSTYAAVDRFAKKPIVGDFVTRMGRVREFPAPKLLQSALDEQIEVILNPLLAAPCTFSLATIRELLAPSE